MMILQCGPRSEDFQNSAASGSRLQRLDFTQLLDGQFEQFSTNSKWRPAGERLLALQAKVLDQVRQATVIIGGPQRHALLATQPLQATILQPPLGRQDRKSTRLN